MTKGLHHPAFTVHLHLARFRDFFFHLEEIQDDLNGRRVKILAESDLHEKRSPSYIYNLSQFLAYPRTMQDGDMGLLDVTSPSAATRLWSITTSTGSGEQLDSIKSVRDSSGSTNAYFAYLEHTSEVMKAPDIEVYRKTKQQIAEQSTKPSYIKYITKASRHKLLAHCESLGEKLIMRMGYEVGLRAMENTGATSWRKKWPERAFWATEWF